MEAMGVSDGRLFTRTNNYVILIKTYITQVTDFQVEMLTEQYSMELIQHEKLKI